MVCPPPSRMGLQLLLQMLAASVPATAAASLNALNRRKLSKWPWRCHCCICGWDHIGFGDDWLGGWFEQLLRFKFDGWFGKSKPGLDSRQLGSWDIDVRAIAAMAAVKRQFLRHKPHSPGREKSSGNAGSDWDRDLNPFLESQPGWWFFATPLENDGVRQLGWKSSQYMENMFQSTNQQSYCLHLDHLVPLNQQWTQWVDHNPSSPPGFRFLSKHVRLHLRHC